MGAATAMGTAIRTVRAPAAEAVPVGPLIQPIRGPQTAVARSAKAR